MSEYCDDCAPAEPWCSEHNRKYCVHLCKQHTNTEQYRQERDEARHYQKKYKEIILLSNNTAARRGKERDRYQAALKKYGEHTNQCDQNAHRNVMRGYDTLLCVCGLTAALKPEVSK